MTFSNREMTPGETLIAPGMCAAASPKPIIHTLAGDMLIQMIPTTPMYIAKSAQPRPKEDRVVPKVARGIHKLGSMRLDVRSRI